MLKPKIPHFRHSRIFVIIKMKFMNLTELQQEEIGRLIKEGFTSGWLDEESGTKITWELNTET